MPACGFALADSRVLGVLRSGALACDLDAMRAMVLAGAPHAKPYRGESMESGRPARLTYRGGEPPAYARLSLIRRLQSIG